MIPNSRGSSPRRWSSSRLFFRRCIEAGQNDGAIADARPADELATLLLLAIRVLARTRLPRALQTFEVDRCASNSST